MRSVADSFREDSRRRLAELSPSARLDLALELGETDLIALCEARGTSVDAARRLIARSRQAGRRPSRCHDE